MTGMNTLSTLGNHESACILLDYEHATPRSFDNPGCRDVAVPPTWVQAGNCGYPHTID